MLILTNGGERKEISLDVLERRYPYGYVLFRPEGNKTKVLQTFKGHIIRINWDEFVVRKVSPEQLAISWPQIDLLFEESQPFKTLPGSQERSVANKSGAREVIAVMGVDDKYRALLFDVLDDHPLRPYYILGVRDFDPVLSEFGPLPFEKKAVNTSIALLALKSRRSARAGPLNLPRLHMRIVPPLQDWLLYHTSNPGLHPGLSPDALAGLGFLGSSVLLPGFGLGWSQA